MFRCLVGGGRVFWGIDGKKMEADRISPPVRRRSGVGKLDRVLVIGRGVFLQMFGGRQLSELTIIHGKRVIVPSCKFPPALRVEYGADLPFIGFFEKVHCPSEHLEKPRLRVYGKVFLGIPFFNKTESIFILDAPEKFTALASFLHPYGAGQGSNRL